MSKRSRARDVWTLLKNPEIVQRYRKPTPARRESHVLFCGTRYSGKSTLCALFSGENLSSPPPASVALSYSYMKRTTAEYDDICHLWELAGGTSLLPLVNEVLTPMTMSSSVLVVVLDCSRPDTVFRDGIRILEYFRVLTSKYAQMWSSRARGDSSVVDVAADLLLSYRQEFYDGHKDVSQVTFLSGVPLIIVATKLDVVMADSSFFPRDSQASLWGGLRYLAHSYGASLLSIGHGMDDSRQCERVFQNILRHFVFENSLHEAFQRKNVDGLTAGGLRIVAGSDSFDEIRQTEAVVPARLKIQGFQRLQQTRPNLFGWYVRFSNVFGETLRDSEDMPLTRPDASHSAEADPEESIDWIVRQKREELERHRKSLQLQRKRLARERRRTSPSSVAKHGE